MIIGQSGVWLLGSQNRLRFPKGRLMIVDRAWAERNLGFDPIARPAPASTFAFAPAVKSPSGDDLRREMIDFDSEAPAGRGFLAFTTATRLTPCTEVPWPKGLG